VAEQSSCSTKSSQILTGLGGFHAENNQARKARRPRPVTPVGLEGVQLRLIVALRTCEKGQQSLCTRIQVGGVVGSAGRGI
jgi:hypothetical protein